jgi:hypothetical protein
MPEGGSESSDDEPLSALMPAAKRGRGRPLGGCRDKITVIKGFRFLRYGVHRF